MGKESDPGHSPTRFSNATLILTYRTSDMGERVGQKIVQVIHRTVRMQLLRSPRLLVRFVSLKSNGSCVRRPGPQLTFISCYPPKLLSLWML